MYSSFGIRKIVSTRRFQLSVHQRHLELELKIRDGAQSADDSGRFLLHRKVDQQSLQRRHLHAVKVADRVPEQLESFLQREERLLLVVMRDGDNYLVKEFPRAFDYVEVAVCHRIEAARINSPPHGSRKSDVEPKTASARAEVSLCCERFAEDRQSGKVARFMADELTYRRIAVASAFSPRFEMVLAEAKRVRDRFDAELNLIYVGEKDEKSEQRFAEALSAMGLPERPRFITRPGALPKPS